MELTQGEHGANPTVPNLLGRETHFWWYSDRAQIPMEMEVSKYNPSWLCVKDTKKPSMTFRCEERPA